MRHLLFLSTIMPLFIEFNPN